jgi:hypothetical protein
MAEQDQIDQMLDSIDPSKNPSVLEGGGRAEEADAGAKVRPRSSRQAAMSPADVLMRP